MDLDELQERNRALSQDFTENLYLLSHQHHFDQGGDRLNFTAPDAQRALLELCDEVKIDALIYDNLSCLYSDIRENDADDWGLVLPSLQDLQRRGISPCIVHHAGRGSGHMRGTSRREDAADWVLQVTASDDDSLPEAGARAKLVTTFTKYRKGNGKDAGPWEWRFETPAEGAVTTVRCDRKTQMDSVVECIKNGLETCGEIAEELKLKKSIVSKRARKAAGEKLVKIEGSGPKTRYIYIGGPQLS